MELNTLLEISFEEYKAADAIGSHSLMDILRSPAHYMANKDGKKETPSLRKGRLIHKAILEGAEFREKAVIQPKFDRRTKQGKEDYASWANDLKPGAIEVSEEESEMIIQIIKNINETKIIKNLLRGGFPERSLFWVDEKTQVTCRSRFDLLTSDQRVVEVKTTRNAQSPFFDSDCIKFGYDLQAAFYLEALRKIGINNPPFIHLAIETEPPYAMTIPVMAESFFEIGNRKWRAALDRYAECKAKNHWPAYEERARMIHPPAYAIYQGEEYE